VHSLFITFAEKHDIIILLFMSSFKPKNKYRFWHHPVFLSFLGLVIVVFSYNVVGLIKKERETAKKKELILNQIDVLKKREAILGEDIDKLKTDMGIEESIREKYQVVKEGEKVVSIVENQEDFKAQTEERKEHGFKAFLKRIFGL
jgi:cell division protein FtsB